MLQPVEGLPFCQPYDQAGLLNNLCCLVPVFHPPLAPINFSFTKHSMYLHTLSARKCVGLHSPAEWPFGRRATPSAAWQFVRFVRHAVPFAYEKLIEANESNSKQKGSGPRGQLRSIVGLPCTNGQPVKEITKRNSTVIIGTHMKHTTQYAVIYYAITSSPCSLLL